ncbi:sulfotransferase [Donghicola sp. XS_ASV15]|uniref:sulfotransferase n=1 Tax=Donghicola sp. XS_ASV15 TaxID=3241295 RepID=UPI0035159FA4
MLQKTVFVITYGRSGSTLLQNMFNALPGYVLRGENNNILSSLVQSWEALRQFSPEQIARMKIAGPLPSGPHQPWFGYEGIDPDQFGQDLAQVFTQRVLRPDADTRVAGFKEIRWHQDPELFMPMLEFLKRFMPDARFIFNTRNHAQVCRSGWWKTMPEAEVRAELEAAEGLYRTWQAAHPECSLAMHYNDYVTSPEAWRPLFAFLEEPFEGALVEEILSRKLMHMKWKGAKKQG